MATTAPRRKGAKPLRFPDRVALICADRHWRLVEYARGLSGGNEAFAEDWVAGAYEQALTQEHQLAHRDDGFIVIRLHDHIRVAARIERERRKSAAYPHPAAPAVLNRATGDAPDLAEQIAERAEADIYAKAFWGLRDSRGRRALVLRTLGYSFAEIAEMLDAPSAAAARVLASRARREALRAVEPIIDGTACRDAQRLMQAALEGRLSAKRRKQLERHMAEAGCACGRIFRMMENGTDLRRLAALLPPALMLPASSPPAATRRHSGAETHEAVKRLLKSGSLSHRQAFERLAAESGRRPAAISAAYYRVERASGEPVRRRERRRPAESAPAPKRPEPNGTAAALAAVRAAVDQLAAAVERQERELARAESERDRYGRIRDIVGAELSSAPAARRGRR